MTVPKYDELFNPLLKAMHALGGSANISEQEDEVSKILNLTDDQINEIHRGNRTKLSYRLAWSRNYLKRYGLIENSSRGVWALTQKGQNVKSVNIDDVVRTVRELDKEFESVEEGVDEGKNPNQIDSVWQDKLIERLLGISPDAFERLCQRVLRESGFIQVEVTGKSGDGGIDGKGIVRINGLLNFHIIFQCKRFSGSVSARHIRDFRGAMAGRADKGLFITTGTFTRDARQEASRDGAPPIDLIDGNGLAEKMKDLGMGLSVRTEEVVEINSKWFDQFK